MLRILRLSLTVNTNPKAVIKLLVTAIQNQNQMVSISLKEIMQLRGVVIQKRKVMVVTRKK
ncbi:hypothetical protein AM438_17820 [Proteus mirabilis]|nr:hypothetical protein AM438_17820 [Proteus mirabilis]